MAADLLLEIGAEEIPAGMCPPALRQLEEDLGKALAEARLACGEVRAVGTPRRLTVWARRVEAKQADARSEALGPPVAQAFDAEGRPTPAALGFARSQGIGVSELGRAQTPKGERLVATKVVKGRRAEAVLPAILERLVAGLRFRKAMRSRWDEVTFARPVRWLAALYGGRPLAVRFGEVVSGRVTYGHRFLAPRAIALAGTPEDYLAKLKRAHVVVDPSERRALVQKVIAAAARRAGGRIRPDAPLLEQVTWLVEYPSAVLGQFEKSNLELPPEVVISEMRDHQRYFAVVDRKGKLSHRFVAVSGTPVRDPRVSRHGYERVLRARLADARFFFEEDRKKPLSARTADLARRTYQAKLGSEQARADRIGAIALRIAEKLAWEPERRQDLLEAARLCKADLTTGMVGEFPELQGIMGAHYARLEGLKPEIADAIEDHYRPVGASSEMPRGEMGALVALGDRLHALVGLLGVGEKATSATDPYGLRRAAIGILRILLDRGFHLSLGELIGYALDALGEVVPAAERKAVAEQTLDFLRGRVRALWGEEFPPDLVEAVLAAGFDDVVDARKRLEALAGLRGRPDFLPLAVAFRRVANIQEKAQGAGAERVDTGLFEHEAERALHAEVERVEREAAELRARRDWPAVLRAVAQLKPAVDRFFEGVLVMAEDARLRDNRLALVRRAAGLFADAADFRRIQVEGEGMRPQPAS